MIKRYLDIPEVKLLEWLTNSAADGMLVVNHDGHIILANPPLLVMFGYSLAALLEQPIEILLPEQVGQSHAALRSRYFNQPSVRAMGSGRELFGRRCDGTQFPVEVSLSPLQTERGAVLVMATVHDISLRKQAEQSLRESQAGLRELGSYMERAREEERKRIAQEIHDELGGILAGIKAHVSVYLERAARAGLAADPLLTEAVGLADTGFQAVRRVISDLRPSVLDQLGVWAALEWYADQVGKRSDLRCECVITEAAASLVPGPQSATMLFRIVQEALTNAVRHAQASLITVHVDTHDQSLRLTVQDNGSGIDAERQTNRESWGITGMRERARYFGGELTISGEPWRGTRVTLLMPLENLQRD